MPLCSMNGEECVEAGIYFVEKSIQENKRRFKKRQKRFKKRRKDSRGTSSMICMLDSRPQCRCSLHPSTSIPFIFHTFVTFSFSTSSQNQSYAQIQFHNSNGPLTNILSVKHCSGHATREEGSLPSPLPLKLLLPTLPLLLPLLPIPPQTLDGC